MGIDRASSREDAKRLRALLERLVPSHEWSEIRRELAEALSKRFDRGGLESQRFLMNTLDVEELVGIDVDVVTLLSSFEDPKDFEDLRRLFSQRVVELIRDQVASGGPTLLFDLDRMLDTSAAVLIPLIADQRQNEIQNAAAYRLGNIVDLRSLWFTGYGYKILSALGAHLVTDIGGLQSVKLKLKAIGQDLLVSDWEKQREESSRSKMSSDFQLRVLRLGIRERQRLPNGLLSSLIAECIEEMESGKLSLLADVVALDTSPYVVVREVLQTRALVEDAQVQIGIGELIKSEKRPSALFKMLRTKEAILEKSVIQKAIGAVIRTSINPQRAIEAIADESSIWNSLEMQEAISEAIRSSHRPWALVRAFGGEGLACTRPVRNAIAYALISVPDPSELVADVLRTQCLREHRELLDAVIECLESRTRKWPLNRLSLEAILAHLDLIPKRVAQRAVADFISSPKTRYRELDVVTISDSITESDVVQAAVADLIRRVNEPLTILDKLRDSEALMMAESVRLAIESSVPSVVEELGHSEYPWRVIAIIKDVDQLASSSRIQSAIAQTIQSSDDPKRIVQALGDSESLLSSPEIEESIASRKSDLR
ncbi:MAG: hypothetical protein ACE5H4_02890 [Candidatus Thorarchaeota archaeon]